MKKIIIVLLATLLSLMMIFPASAHDAITSTAWGTPEIDGIRDAIWDQAEMITIAAEDIPTDADKVATAKVWTLWDSAYLYVFCDITDPIVDAELKDDAWNQDCIGIMIDYAYDREEGKNYRDLGDGSYAGYVNVPAVEGRANYPEVPSVFGIQKYIDGTQSYCKLTSAGYIVEIRVPLAYKNYTAGDKIGFEICLNNSNGNGVREGQTVWVAGGGNSWQCSADMGTIIFSAKSEEAAPAVQEITADAPAADTAPVTASPQTGDGTVIIFALLSILGVGFVIINKKDSLWQHR